MILRGVPLHVLLSTRVPDTSTTWARDLHHLLFACSLLVVLGQVKVMSSASFMSTLNAHTKSGNACMLAAPTGVAAFNIGGLTIHRALNLPVEHDRSTAYKKLSAERLHELRCLWKDVHDMIIDEISMVSYQTFTFIHKRLTEIKGTDDTEVHFGGISIIAVGDFFQLPPVRDRFVFQDGKGHVQGATHLWRTLFIVNQKH